MRVYIQVRTTEYTSNTKVMHRFVMRLGVLVVDYLINNTSAEGETGGRNKRETYGVDISKKESCHEGKGLCKVPARRRGGSKNYRLSVNIPRELTE